MMQHSNTSMASANSRASSAKFFSFRWTIAALAVLFELQACQAFRAHPMRAQLTNPISMNGISMEDASWTFRQVACTRAGSLQQTALNANRKPVVGGNWKCNGTVSTSREIVEMLNQIPSSIQNVEVIVAPPAIHVPYVSSALRGPVRVASQDSSTEQGFGAFTGEISPKMLKDFGINYTLTGHSERRAGFGGQPGESSQVVALKTKVAIDSGLDVIACIGESLEERTSNMTLAVLGQQLEALKKALTEDDWRHVVVAYEPIWAIGTGKTATPQIAQETHMGIRQWLSQNVSPRVAESTRIIYGGSVKGSNAAELITQPDIDGFLVGGASLTNDFLAIVTSAASN